MNASAPKSLATTVIRQRDTFLRTVRDERRFLILLGGSLFVVGAVYPYPEAARWVGFMLAGYATVANDSIQTLGTFIASNRHRPWWALWLYIGGVFLLTIGYGWWNYGGDVSYGRLTAKGFEQTPVTFSFLQVAAPLFLLILTRLRMPVSTTFLILSCFATSSDGIQAMLFKSVSGYGVAFVAALLVWGVLRGTIQRWAQRPPHPAWGPLQWASTGVLWATWIMQDAANIAVYLPRSLTGSEFGAFAGFIVAGLGVLFFMRGDRIQRVVDEKADVTDVRAATLIDVIYAMLLFGFKEVSVVPMSTTWVFIGLLAGREVVLRLMASSEGLTPRASWRLMRRDLAYAGIGLVVSIALAIATNPELIG